MKCDTTQSKSHRMGKMYVESIFNKSSLSQEEKEVIQGKMKNLFVI